MAKDKAPKKGEGTPSSPRKHKPGCILASSHGGACKLPSDKTSTAPARHFPEGTRPSHLPN